jgi:hypothetical protein
MNNEFLTGGGNIYDKRRGVLDTYRLRQTQLMHSKYLISAEWWIKHEVSLLHICLYLESVMAEDPNRKCSLLIQGNF